MRAFNGSIFMGEAGIVSGRNHTVRGANAPIALGHILFCVLVGVAERHRNAVGAMLAVNSAKSGQSCLQILGISRETLAAEHHLSMAEAETTAAASDTACG